ncbi:NRT1/ PTR FAMILY 1.1 [Thalictrum thalictroides]|uniref:NRT1/ PTR FAMILY 1.1 n=1 Tax=Thalictrum thalictroides TaxID=46969 RepID=A0A7J6XAW0_THATH|nr:NRT1/ PTR FAMILY 1.1 [Thalictrum thalictroides]
MSYRSSKEDMEDSHKPQDSKKETSGQKGGLRTIPFILANESFQYVASVGILPNMIFYMINGYNMDTAPGASILSIWGSSSDFLSIFGAFISDAYLGRFRVIAFGSIISFLGMTLLWLTAIIPQARPAPCDSLHSGCQNPTFVQLAFLVLSLGFNSVGAGCIKPCSLAFGVDQLINQDNQLEKNERLVQRFFNWYYACASISSAIAMTAIVYIQDQFGWNVGFGVPAILMLVSASVFLGGSSLYVKMKGDKNMFTGLVQVVVAAIKNRHLPFPPDNSDGLYWHKTDSNLRVPSNKQRYLNKACIIKNPVEDFNEDGSATNPWELCSVEQVEALKGLISIIPIWSTGIIFYLISNQATFATIQATSMNRHITSNFQIPAGSFSLFIPLSVAIWLPFYDGVILPLVERCTGRPGGLSPKLRIGIGLFMSCLCMVYAAIVESIRRSSAIQAGFMDDPTGVVNMSALWLIPQFCLLGFAVALNAVGQYEYFYSKLPKSMASMVSALYNLGTAFSGLLGGFIVTLVNNVTKSGGNTSWLSTNLNKGHYDYHYTLISFLCLLNFLYYLLVCQFVAYDEPENDVRARFSDENENLTETLLSSKSRQF